MYQSVSMARMPNFECNIKLKNIDVLKDIIWGSKLFTNTQVICKLVSLLDGYYKGECTVFILLQFVHTIEKQQKVKLYKELQIELSEFVQVEKFLHNKSVIDYCVNRLWRNLARGRVLKHV